MARGMEHERMRWSYMTEKQLLKRLSKITHPDKEDRFKRLALEFDKFQLLNAACERENELRGLARNDVNPVQAAGRGDCGDSPGFGKAVQMIVETSKNFLKESYNGALDYSELEKRAMGVVKEGVTEDIPARYDLITKKYYVVERKEVVRKVPKQGLVSKDRYIDF